MSGKLSLACVAVSLAFAGSAFGDRSADQRRNGPSRSGQHVYNRGGDRRHQAPRRGWGSQAHEVRERQTVFPAQYETIREKVWVQPVYEWVTRKVWVPAPRGRRQIGLRIGKFSLNLGGSRGHGRGPGHYETVRDRVLVREGYYETVNRSVLVRPERIEVVHQKVRAGRGYRNRVGAYAVAPSHGSSGRGALGRRGIGRRAKH